MCTLFYIDTHTCIKSEWGRKNILKTITDNCIVDLPNRLISVVADPVLPNESVAVHVCNPASYDVSIFCDTLIPLLSYANDLGSVDVH